MGISAASPFAASPFWFTGRGGVRVIG